MELFHTFSIAFMAFFAIMNPSATLPVYLSLTSSESPATSKTIALRACLIAFLIVAIFSLSGKMLFELFGISISALRIAGGVLIFMIGYQMVQGSAATAQHPSNSDQHAAQQEEGTNVAISPLATPMMAGPGTIATAMNLSAHNDIAHSLVTIAAFALLCFITYLIYLGGKPLVRFLGQNIMTVITRLMGLILAVIGVQMLVTGIHSAFPAITSVVH
ncbi:MarC family protein [Cardiobacteriaceae bacterium TAE3-ERU3]|nr:MarC family protein [Cardiobacteriaceae bacterium TAE3-ERU3]